MGPYGIGTSRAAEPRIGGQRRQPVPGHLDFGNHLDMPLCGVADDLADLLLRVELAVGFAVVNALFVLVVASDERFRTPGPDLGEQRIFFDLDPPALIVGQMPVEFVDLVQREDVDVGLHVLDREEMAADVEHRPAVGERGLVADDAGGNLSSGDQLLEAAKPVQHRLGRRCRDRYALSADFQKVLFGFVARLQLQRHGVFFGCGGDGGFGSGEFADGAGENLRGRAQLFVRDDDGRSGRQPERSRQFFDLGGAGYDADASVAGCESRQTGLDGENQE